jgi:hypothetical protein
MALIMWRNVKTAVAVGPIESRGGHDVQHWDLVLECGHEIEGYEALYGDADGPANDGPHIAPLETVCGECTAAAGAVVYGEESSSPRRSVPGLAWVLGALLALGALCVALGALPWR